MLSDRGERFVSMWCVHCTLNGVSSPLVMLSEEVVVLNEISHPCLNNGLNG